MSEADRYKTLRPQQSHHWQTPDGQTVFYRHWPAQGVCRGSIVLLHRGHEHSGRMAHLVDELGLEDFEFFAWDARGNGRSSGMRGDAPGFMGWVRDLDGFMAHLGSQHGVQMESTALVAQSVGAVIAAAWAHDYAPRLRAMVLASPAFKVKLYVPLARPALAMLYKLRGNFQVNSYVKAKFLTHDPERIASYEQDPLITRPISVRVLLGLYKTSERIVDDAAAIIVPTQLLVSAADFVVHRAPQDRFFERLGAAVKERHLLPGFYHDTLGERDRGAAIAKMRKFLLARFDEGLNLPSQLEAHRHGVRFDEAEKLAWPLPKWSAEGLYWRATRAGLRLGGKLSKGIRLGLETGFDSGSTLDYVYENQARGAGPLGRFVDRNYLDAIGWRGIRIRREHLRELLALAMQRLRDAGMPVHAVDIAAGHGRYVLEALAGTPAARADSILLRDYSPLNVEKGRQLIRALSADDIARFEPGNAFDGENLAGLQPSPTLAVVSGLYELFPDNALLQASLAGLARAVPAGGYLAYTGQPWHPQLAFIARALTSHRDGEAWVMRRRSQAEMDELVQQAGFKKVAQRIDDFGIFTVSLAQREG
ncbi:hypothetical protein CO610_10630 [Lysobacteraceae bacterium NML95-0200]|nr:hypothetical protein CO610_10630 [Xanthomonadaceae bacterium NML95-0200]